MRYVLTDSSGNILRTVECPEGLAAQQADDDTQLLFEVGDIGLIDDTLLCVDITGGTLAKRSGVSGSVLNAGQSAAKLSPPG